MVPEENENKSRSEIIYREMRKRILMGIYVPQTRMLVLDIANEFKVSQAPVREAFERLKQEGLLIGVKNKGSFVSSIEPKEIEDVYVLRSLMEKHIMEIYLDNRLPEEIEHLESIYKGMLVAVENNDLLRLIELDMLFHEFFYEKIGNIEILRVWKYIKLKIMRFIITTNQLYFPDLRTLADRHLELINSLKDDSDEIILKKFDTHNNEVWWKMKKTK